MPPLDFTDQSAEGRAKPKPEAAPRAATNAPDFSAQASKSQPKGRYSQTYTEEKAKARKELAPIQNPFTKNLPSWLRDPLEHVGGMSDAFTSQPVLPVLDEINAGVRAGGNEVANLFRAPDKKVDSEAIWLARLDAEKEAQEAKRQKYPVSTLLGGIGSGIVAAPEAAAIRAGAPVLKGAVNALTGRGAPVASEIAATQSRLAGVKGARALEQAVTASGQAPGKLAAAGRFAKGVAKGTAGATAGGGAYGLLDAEATPEGRVEGLLEGMAGGAIAAPLLAGGAAVGGPLVGKVAAKIRQAGIPAEERAAATARGVVTDLMEGSRIRSAADVANRHQGEFQGQRAIAADLGGKSSEAMLRNVGVRKGKTGDAATLMAISRERARPGEIREAARTDLKVDPATAEGDVISMIEAGEGRAKPLFQAALDVPEGASAPGVWTPELSSLSQRPVVREAMERAALEERNWGRSPEGLSWGEVEVPDGAAAPTWDDLSFDAGPTEAQRRTGEGGVRGGTSMLTRISQLGGLRDSATHGTHGELRASGADQWHRGKAYMRRLIGSDPEKAQSIEDIASILHAEGYFPELVGQDPPLPRDMFDFIRDEVAEPSRILKDGQLIQRRDSTIRPGDEPPWAHLGETHPDDVPRPEQYQGSPAPPPMEPAMSQAPTARSWDNVRRELNRLAGWEHSSSALERSKAPAARQAVIDLTNVLTGKAEGSVPAIPYLKEALQESGDYIRIRETYKDFGERLFKDSAEFNRAFDKLSGAGEQKAAQAAMMTDINKLWGRGKLAGAKFDTPNIRANLEKAFGPEKAGAFIQKMEVQARLSASNKRYMSDSGSQTAKLMMANEGLPPEAGGSNPADAIQFAAMAATQPKQTLINAVAKGAKKAFSTAKTAELPETTRDEIGRILMMGPEDFGKWLEAKPAAARAKWRDIRRKAIGLFASQQQQHPEGEEAY